MGSWSTYMSIFGNIRMQIRKKWPNQFKNFFNKHFKEYYLAAFCWWIPSSCENHCTLLPTSLIRGVGDSPHHRYWESAMEFFKRKLSVSMIRRVIDSLHQWYGESPTPHIVESESCRLWVSPIQRVDDSVYRWVGSRRTPRIGDTGSCYSKLRFDFQYFKRLKHAFKGSIWPTISQGCNLLSKLNFLKVWK